MRGWKILERELLGVHKYVAFEIVEDRRGAGGQRRKGRLMLNKEKLERGIREWVRKGVNAGSVTCMLMNVQKESIIGGSRGGKEKPFWWNELIETR